MAGGPGFPPAVTPAPARLSARFIRPPEARRQIKMHATTGDIVL